MDELAELDAAFHRLLLDSGARAALARDPGVLGWSPRVTELLRAAGTEDFRRLGRAIVKGVGSGNLCGIDLHSAFRATIALLVPLPADAVMERFVASPEFREIRAVGNVAGYSPARAFYDWACATQAAPEVHAAAQHDYVRITLLTLASVPAAYFSPQDSVIRPVDRGWIAVLDSGRHLPHPEAEPDHPLAVGAVRGKFWSVKLSSRFAAALLRATPAPPAWSTALLTDDETAPLLSAMRAKGML
jgi:hypothetical protein